MIPSNSGSLDGLFGEIANFEDHAVEDFSKNIFLYWDTGLETAPDIVRLAKLMAETLNSEYNIVFLDKNTIQSLFPYRRAIEADMTVELVEAHFADILRTYLICKFGGGWLDASCIVTNPFSVWLEPILEKHDFFLWKNDSYADRLIMNWFIAGKANSTFLAQVLRILLAFFTKKRKCRLQLTQDPTQFCPAELIGPTATDMRAISAIEERGFFPYFIYHYICNEVVKHNEKLSEALAALPRPPLHVRKFNHRDFKDSILFDKVGVDFVPSLPKIAADRKIRNDIRELILSALCSRPPIKPSLR